jgi:rifampicin phosphotransferase
MKYVRLLSELGAQDLPLAGGKGANLGELVRAGERVPAGFCVVTAGYRAFVQANGFGPEILRLTGAARSDTPASLESASDAIRSLFARGRMPTDLEAELRAAYAELGARLADVSGAGAPAVAVRSSATAEDLPDTSFAGQQDTYLNIVGEEALLNGVRRCWASLWTARAIGYRARNCIASQEVALAVIVQAMVESVAAGVLFTANPLTGKRGETVIDASLGLGEALVSGMVEPDHYVIAKGRIMEKTLGSKSISIRARKGGGTLTVEESAADRQALPDELIGELEQLGQRVEKHFGNPQDIEWGLSEGKLFVLQSRPITSLFPVPQRAEGELFMFFSLAAIQGMFAPFTPLGADGFHLIGAAFSNYFGLHRTPYTQRALYEAAGRLWLNFTPLIRSRLGRRLLGVVISFIDPASRDSLDLLLKDPRLAVRGRMTARTRWAFVRMFSRVVGRMIFNLAAPPRGRARLKQDADRMAAAIAARHAKVKSLEERVAAFEESVRVMPPVFFSSFIPAVSSGVMPTQILRALCKGLPDAERLMLELTRGLPHNVTTEMDLILWDTARAIAADDAARASFLDADAADVSARFLAGALPRAAQDAMGKFLDRYGMRGVGEIDLGRPRWRDEPASLIQAVSSYLRIAGDAAAPDRVFQKAADSAQAAGNALVAMLASQPGGKKKARRARFLISRVRELAGLREMPKFAAVRALTAQREGLLASGAELARRGILEKRDDIFFLRLADLKEIAQGEGRGAAPAGGSGDGRGAAQGEGRGAVQAGGSGGGQGATPWDARGAEAGRWRALVRDRRADHERELRRVAVPRILLSDGTAFYGGAAETDPNAETVRGSPVSPGVAEGAVRVVLDPRGAELAPGEILVCPGTDPAWTPLFLAAAGLVMEVGGMMTHGSVVAREYGIPAVVGVSGATTRLSTGMRIRVDGNNGSVTILK